MIDNHDKQTRTLEYCLHNTFCFSGWAWGHLYWEPTYIYLMERDNFEWFQKFGYTWEDFAGTGSNDGLIQKCVIVLAGFPWGFRSQLFRHGIHGFN